MSIEVVLLSAPGPEHFIVLHKVPSIQYTEKKNCVGTCSRTYLYFKTIKFEI